MAAFDPYYEWLGIPPKDQPPHHYRLLGVELYEDHLTAIDAAANRIMAYLQELSNGDNGALAQQLLNEVSAARVCLLNKKRKAAYDQTLKTTLSNKKQKKKNQPAVAKHPPPLPTAAPLGADEEAPFPALGKTEVPQTSTEDRRQETAPAAASRRTGSRAKQGEKRIVMVAIGLLLIVAVGLGIYSFRQPKVPSRTDKTPAPRNAPRNASSQHPQNKRAEFFSEAKKEVDLLVQNMDISFQKKDKITTNTIWLITPVWKTIAVAKPAKRKESYQLALEHAKRLIKNHNSFQDHVDKKPFKFGDRAYQEFEKKHRNKHGKKFDAELAQLLDPSE